MHDWGIGVVLGVGIGIDSTNPKWHGKFSTTIQNRTPNWVPLRIDFMQSAARGNLSAFGSKLLLDLLSLYNGFNNGDLACAYDGIMKAKGWRSETTLRKAVKELLAANIIVLTRQGGRNKTEPVLNFV